MPIPVRNVGATFPVSELAGDVPPISMPTPALTQDSPLDEARRVSWAGESKPNISQTNRLYVPDTAPNSEAMLVVCGSTFDNQIGFNARTLVISNWTIQFAWIECIKDWIPPYTIEMVRQIPSGTQNAKVLWEAPPGVTQPGANTAERMVLVFSEDFLMPSPGLNLKPPTLP